MRNARAEEGFHLPASPTPRSHEDLSVRVPGHSYPAAARRALLPADLATKNPHRACLELEAARRARGCRSAALLSREPAAQQRGSRQQLGRRRDGLGGRYRPLLVSQPHVCLLRLCLDKASIEVATA